MKVKPELLLVRSVGGKHKYLYCSLLLCLASVHLTIYINMEAGPLNPLIPVCCIYHMLSERILMFLINLYFFLTDCTDLLFSEYWFIQFILCCPNIHYLNISSLMTLIFPLFTLLSISWYKSFAFLMRLNYFSSQDCYLVQMRQNTLFQSHELAHARIINKQKNS